MAYPILDAVRRELSWTHYRLLLRVEKPDARAFYEAEAVNRKLKEIHTATHPARKERYGCPVCSRRRPRHRP